MFSFALTASYSGAPAPSGNRMNMPIAIVRLLAQVRRKLPNHASRSRRLNASFARLALGADPTGDDDARTGPQRTAAPRRESPPCPRKPHANLRRSFGVEATDDALEVRPKHVGR